MPPVHLEVVPAEHEAFVFLGKPPLDFGLAWIHDGKVTGLKEFIQEHHLKPGQVEKLLDRLGEAYEHARETPRYAAEFGGKQLVVIPSKELEREVHQIMEGTLHYMVNSFLRRQRSWLRLFFGRLLPLCLKRK